MCCSFLPRSPVEQLTSRSLSSGKLALINLPAHVHVVFAQIMCKGPHITAAHWRSVPRTLGLPAYRAPPPSPGTVIPASSGGGGGISTGAIAGIAVSLVLGLIIAIILACASLNLQCCCSEAAPSGKGRLQ